MSGYFLREVISTCETLIEEIGDPEELCSQSLERISEMARHEQRQQNSLLQVAELTLDMFRTGGLCRVSPETMEFTKTLEEIIKKAKGE